MRVSLRRAGAALLGATALAAVTATPARADGVPDCISALRHMNCYFEAPGQTLRWTIDGTPAPRFNDFEAIGFDCTPGRGYTIAVTVGGSTTYTNWQVLCFSKLPPD
ncbi:MAG TPA: hypothetical protein VMU51_09080 [Mycobacteriales bacterium]|nr:hypothetical protein [Mycobacteriales bacterium]